MEHQLIISFMCGMGSGAVLALVALWIFLIVAMRQPGGH